MPKEKGAEEMEKAEKEIGKNLPDEMKGLDTEDVGDVEPSSEEPATE
jgi:hypothetical protein